MNRWTRYVLVGLAGAIVGAVCSIAFHWYSLVTYLIPATDSFVVAQASTWVSAHRSSADASGYEDALRAYLSALDAATIRDTSGANQRTYRAEKALTLIRLSETAKNRGELDEQAKLRQAAAELCPVWGQNPCNADTLSELTQKLDDFWNSKGK